MRLYAAKDVSKTLIKKYREERRAKKEGVKLPRKAPKKRAARVLRKAATPANKAPKRAAQKATKNRTSKKAMPATAPTRSVSPAAATGT